MKYQTINTPNLKEPLRAVAASARLPPWPARPLHRGQPEVRTQSKVTQAAVYRKRGSLLPLIFLYKGNCP